jgi:hypothetical protein
MASTLRTFEHENFTENKTACSRNELFATVMNMTNTAAGEALKGVGTRRSTRRSEARG